MTYILQKIGFNITVHKNEQEKVPEAGKYQIVICNNLFLYNDIRKFKNLRYIQLTSSGYDRIPYQFIKEAGIELHNAHDVYSIPIAEFVIMRILDYYKNSRFFFENQKSANWIKDRGLKELYGKIVLIIGCGGIGLEIGKRLCPFGAYVIGMNRHIFNSPYVSECTTVERLDDIIGNIDILICSMPLTKETKHFLNMTIFKKMKKTSIVVNISRGEIIKTDDLIEALTGRMIGGAILDVFEEEPLRKTNILWGLPNVILSPHNAFVGEGNAKRLADVILYHLAEWLNTNYCTI